MEFKLTNHESKVLFIITFIMLLIYENFKLLEQHLVHKYKIKKNIFTFWEPKEKIPGYIQLCIKTWKKILPEYNIIILDYETVNALLGETLFSNIICKEMTKDKQADAVRVAILKKYGGIWMDADTIILNSEFIKKFHNYELGMFGVEGVNYHFNFYFLKYSKRIFIE